MNNIIITSNGFSNASYRSDEINELFKKVANGKKVLIIANAANKSSSNFIQRRSVKKNFEIVGAKKVNILELNAENVRVILKYDILYVMGGQIQELIYLINKTEFKKYLYEFIKKGTYIGESAGSIVLEDDTKWYFDLKKNTKEKYSLELDTYKGLSLSKFHIYPHFNDVTPEILDKIRSSEVNITALNDGEYIII